MNPKRVYYQYQYPIQNYVQYQNPNANANIVENPKNGPNLPKPKRLISSESSEPSDDHIETTTLVPFTRQELQDPSRIWNQVPIGHKMHDYLVVSRGTPNPDSPYIHWFQCYEYIKILATRASILFQKSKSKSKSTNNHRYEYSMPWFFDLFLEFYSSQECFEMKKRYNLSRKTFLFGKILAVSNVVVVKEGTKSQFTDLFIPKLEEFHRSVQEKDKPDTIEMITMDTNQSHQNSSEWIITNVLEEFIIPYFTLAGDKEPNRIEPVLLCIATPLSRKEKNVLEKAIEDICLFFSFFSFRHVILRYIDPSVYKKDEFFSWLEEILFTE